MLITHYSWQITNTDVRPIGNFAPVTNKAVVRNNGVIGQQQESCCCQPLLTKQSRKIFAR